MVSAREHEEARGDASKDAALRVWRSANIESGALRKRPGRSRGALGMF